MEVFRIIDTHIYESDLLWNVFCKYLISFVGFFAQIIFSVLNFCNYFYKFTTLFLITCRQLIFFPCVYNLHFFKQNVYSHQVLIYLNVAGIPVRKPLENSQIVEEQLDVWILGVICASLLTGRHLLINKKDKNSRYTNIKIMIIWRKT